MPRIFWLDVLPLVVRPPSYYRSYNFSGSSSVPKQTTIRAIGNSAGTTIPKPMLERYQLAEGDTVHLVETEDGILITPFDPAFEEAMAIYAEGAKRYRNAMRELAK
jgi:putative addiction module antidote